jgi:hypothetical protein
MADTESAAKKLQTIEVGRGRSVRESAGDIIERR